MELKQVIECEGKRIETTVTSSGSRINTWIRKITSSYANMKMVVIGLGTESKPNTRPKEKNKVSTLELSVCNKCLVIQLIHVDYIPRSLNKLLYNMRYVFVGAEVESHVAKLNEDYGLVCRRYCDVRKIALEKWSDRMKLSSCPDLKELSKVVGRMAVVEKPRNVVMSNWQKEILSEMQIEYACLHAYASFRIGMNLRSELK